MRGRSLLIGLLLTALGGAAADLPRNPSATNAPMPKRGGTLRLAEPTDLNYLDPALAFDAVTQPFIMLLYEGLVEYGDGLDLVPNLAKDWTLSEDQRTYTFHLRSGVRFSNGREVTAADFVYSLQRTLNPKTDAPTESFFEGIAGAKDFRAGKTNSVRGLRAPQNDTLVIEIEEPNPPFLYILSLPGALVVPREAVEKYGESFPSHPVGTGPYALAEWRRGLKMRFERNPFSTHPERQNLDAVDVLVGGDHTLHLMMFERGELELPDVSGFGIPVSDYVRIAHSPRWQGLVEKMPVAATDWLVLNTEMEPFDNLKVRQAMNYAIDKQKMVRLLHGMVIPARGVLPPMMPGYNSNLVEYPFDPAKARQLLAESGHPNGFSCKLWFAGGGLTGPITSSLQYDLAQVGINAQLNPVSYAPLVDSVGRRKTVQTSIGGWVQDYPDPSDFLDTLFNGAKITAENCQNNAFYNNPKVNQLLADAAACKDPAKRLRIYQAVEESVMADAPIVPLDHPYAFSLRQPWLHGVQLHPVLTFRFERMWIER